VIFPEVLGQDNARGIVSRLLRSGRIPHALLFHGPEGVGKGLVARLLAKSIVCLQPGRDGEACGACAACRRAEHGNHPDVFLVNRLPKKDKRPDASSDPSDEDDGDYAPPSKTGELRPFIVIQQIRELNHHATYAPREARRRIFLVDPADRMNAESQNALLKTLEEPSGQAIIVLIASRPHGLLPTVRSRCFQVGFASMRPETLAQALATRGMELAEARARAALAEGRPGLAMTLDLPGLRTRRELILASLESLAAAPTGAAELGVYSDRILGEAEPELLEGLGLAAALLRDAARRASGCNTILHADLASRIEKLGRTLGAGRASDLAALTDRLRGELRLNVNKTLVVEALLAAVAGGPFPVFA
jgi:DNA polymerase-3 subunit delta'